jgi:thiol-disulfide isomerase/thioredoxin
VVELVVVLAIILGVRAWQQQGVASGPAPPLAGVLLDGQEYFSLAAPDGQAEKPLLGLSPWGRLRTPHLGHPWRSPVLVHFWSTWCPVCRLEQSSIDALARRAPVITVAMQSGDRDAVARHLRNEALSFPVLNDPDGAIAARWGVRAVPASFIVDGAGQIRYVETGYTTGVGLRLRLWLAGL